MGTGKSASRGRLMSDNVSGRQEDCVCVCTCVCVFSSPELCLSGVRVLILKVLKCSHCFRTSALLHFHVSIHAFSNATKTAPARAHTNTHTNAHTRTRFLLKRKIEHLILRPHSDANMQRPQSDCWGNECGQLERKCRK